MRVSRTEDLQNMSVNDYIVTLSSSLQSYLYSQWRSGT